MGVELRLMMPDIQPVGAVNIRRELTAEDLVNILRTSDSIEKIKEAAFALARSENEEDHDELYRMALGDRKEGSSGCYNLECMLIGYESLSEVGTEKSHQFVCSTLRFEMEITGYKHIIGMNSSRGKGYEEEYLESHGNLDTVYHFTYPNAPKQLRKILEVSYAGSAEPVPTPEEERIDKILIRTWISYNLRNRKKEQPKQ